MSTGNREYDPSMMDDYATSRTYQSTPASTHTGTNDPSQLKMTEGMGSNRYSNFSTTTSNPSYQQSGGGLTNTQAGMISSGIQAGAMLGQGIAESKQMGDLSKQAYLQGIGDLSKYRQTQRENQKLQTEAQDFADEQQDFRIDVDNVAMSLNLMQRDLRNEMDKFNESQQAKSDIEDAFGADANFREMLFRG